MVAIRNKLFLFLILSYAHRCIYKNTFGDELILFKQGVVLSEKFSSERRVTVEMLGSHSLGSLSVAWQRASRQNAHTDIRTQAHSQVISKFYHKCSISYKINCCSTRISQNSAARTGVQRTQTLTVRAAMAAYAHNETPTKQCF